MYTAAPEDFEEWIAFISAQLGSNAAQEPGPDGSVHFTGGDPPLVVVHLKRSIVTVWEYAASWDESNRLIPSPIRIGVLAFRRLPESAARGAMAALIDAARESRLSTFAVCRFCATRTAPEWLHEDDVCQQCAQEHLGVVYEPHFTDSR